MKNSVYILLSFILPAFLTTLGSGLIFFFKKSSKTISSLTIGVASGIMLSASFWSLLLPALEQAQEQTPHLAFLPISLGFLIGCLFMVFLDRFSLIFFKKNNKNTQKAFKLWTAITIHNIPEGLSVGFAIGSAFVNQSNLLTPFIFTLGIALQNFPEGMATALPIYSCVHKPTISFFLGTLSGLVEPIFALAGFFLSTVMSGVLPWLLSLAAGAMIYVIVEELLPELQIGNKKSLGTWSFVIGFVIMMLLDISL